MSQSVNRKVLYQPKSKKKKLDHRNETSEHVRLFFLDGSFEHNLKLNHHYNSLLRKKLSSPTVVCLNDAKLVPSSSLNTFDLGSNLCCAKIHQSKRWFITVNRVDNYDGSMIRVFNLDGGEKIFNKVIPTLYKKMLVLERKNVMYLVNVRGEFCKILLDIDQNFPILNSQVFSEVFRQDTHGFTYSSFRDELIVLDEDKISVFEEETLKFKYSTICECKKSVHYNEINDELWLFANSKVDGASLSIYCGNNFETLKKSYQFRDLTHSSYLELLYDLEFDNIFVFRYKKNRLILVDKVSLIPLIIINENCCKRLFMDKQTKTILGIRYETLNQFKLELDTNSIDLPLDIKIVEKLIEIGARTPNYFLRKKDIPDSVGYLTQITLERNFHYQVLEEGINLLAHKIFEMFYGQYLNQIDTGEMWMYYPFTFHLKTPKPNRLQKKFPNEKVHIIATSEIVSRKFLVGVLDSDARKEPNDFRLFILSKYDLYQTTLVHCKLSDFIQLLTLRFCTIVKEEDKIHGYSFDLNDILKNLKTNMLIDPITLEINSTKLRETYHFIFREEFEDLRKVLDNFRDENVKIDGKQYSIVDLLVLNYGRNLKKLDPYLDV